MSRPTFARTAALEAEQIAEEGIAALKAAQRRESKAAKRQVRMTAKPYYQHEFPQLLHVHREVTLGKAAAKRAPTPKYRVGAGYK